MSHNNSIVYATLSLIAIICSEVSSLKPHSIDSGSSNSEICLQKAANLDKCLPKLVVYGDRNFDPPKTEQKLDEHCRLIDSNLKCVSSYSRDCLPSFARNLYSVVVRRLKTQFAKICKSADGRRDFINLMACADREYMEPSHRCMDAFVAQLEHVGTGAQGRQIELTCCAFQLFQECIFVASKTSNCPHRVVSSEKSIDYVKTIINSMGGDMMDFMCGKFDKISNCNTGYPTMMSQFRIISERVRNGTMKSKSNSPIKPMLQLFINSQEEDS